MKKIAVILMPIALLLSPSFVASPIRTVDAIEPCIIIQSLVSANYCIGGGGGGSGTVKGNIIGKVVNYQQEHDPLYGAVVIAGKSKTTTDYNGNFKLVGLSTTSVDVSYTYNGVTYKTGKTCKVEKSTDNDCGLFTINGPTPVSQMIHSLVNQARRDVGLPQLQWKEQVAEYARDWSENMAYMGESKHSNWDQGLKSICPRARGENIAFEYTYNNSGDQIAKKVVEGWMKSPVHKDNILNRNYQSEGVGVAWTDEKVYVTENFCA